MGELWAHSANDGGVRHRLEDHLRGTAALAHGFGEPFGAADLAAYLGLTHDVGKAGCAWQRKLLAVEPSGGSVGIDHKLAGTWLAHRSAGPFAACIFGHHGGLPALAALKQELRAASADPDKNKEWEEAARLAAEHVPEIITGSRENLLPGWLEDEHAATSTAPDMLARMLFSTLADADFLDTEAHFRSGPRPLSDLSIGDLTGRYENRRRAMLADREPSPVDGWRAEVYAAAVNEAAGPQGVYKLAAPTGSGKTIAAGGFGVHHARVHGLRRVVLAVPFISITEQNAAEYRKLLDEPGQPVVLEHHSSADLDRKDAPGAWWRKLAAENWDAPFVVTTTAQLFQSLFDNRPAAMRKLHRLAGSVIILDEVQALPDRLLLPILSALRVLTEKFGATVLLASATQPSYWSLKPFHGLNAHEVIKDPGPLYTRFRRVRYKWRLDPPPLLAEIAKEAAAERQVLVVVNTTADSAAVHRHLQGQRPRSFGICLHLSTRMAAGHRREVLEQVRGLLEAREPVAVVATQLIEAGVDIDFPIVYRAWAPADSLQQAAGRANRNGWLAEGRVVIFRPSDGGQPGDSSYKAALAATETHFGPGLADPDNLDALGRYYPERYRLQNLERSGRGFDIEELRKLMDFPQVAEKFQLIEEHTVPATVRYPGCDEARLARIITRLWSSDSRAAGEARHLLRELSPYLATIPKAFARKAVAAGYAEPIVGGLIEWQGPYHAERGIDPAELTELNNREVYVW